MIQKPCIITSLDTTQEKQRHKYLESVVPFHQVFFVLIGGLPLWPNPTKRNNHMQ